MFQEKVHDIVHEILQSYDELGGINHSNGINLPSRESVVSILRDLEALIFPGFQDSAVSDCETLPYTTAQRVFGIARALIREVGKSLKHRSSGAQENQDKINEEASRISFALLRRIPALRKLISGGSKYR